MKPDEEDCPLRVGDGRISARMALGGTSVTDSSGPDAQPAAVLDKGTPLNFTVEATQPGSFVVPDQLGYRATAWIPPAGSFRGVAP